MHKCYLLGIPEGFYRLHKRIELLKLQAWELGRWVHFYGLAQWVGWVWPFAAIVWLLARLSRRGAAS